MQKVSLWCERYSQIVVRTSNLKGEILGEVSAPMELAKRSIVEGLAKKEFLAQATRNTFPS